ncbi:MAG: IS110 family transposase, partial [Treponema sp.]|nr:IS110 family transposase [Treponema sp.]
MARSRAYAWHDQGLTRAAIKGLRAARSRAYTCHDQGRELPARLLEEEAGCRVLPLNPGDLRILRQPRKKTDREDALKTAKYLRNRAKLVLPYSLRHGG